MDNEYFWWLLGKIGYKSGYLEMLTTLYLKKFYSVVPLDDNRAEDGKDLRLLYLEETDNTGAEAPEDQCRVLEMLVAFAMRIETAIFHDDALGDRSGKWFWEMIHNLGLDRYNDRLMKTSGSSVEVEIDHILDVFLDRKYKKNGEGGLFPLKNSKKDQRKVELWYQMCEYGNENWV